MARRLRTTARVRAAAKHNIVKAQITRIRTREPRAVGRTRPLRKVGVVRRR